MKSDRTGNLTTGGERTVPVQVPVDGTVLSGYARTVPQPRATLVALHGGGSHAGYFHGSAHPDQSLIDLAGRLGYNAIALDRPGYGTSAGMADHLDLDARAEVVAAAVRTAFDDLGAGMIVVAHSLGTQVAVHMAARIGEVIGLEFSGSGLEYRPGLFEDPATVRSRLFDLLWGDPDLYPAGALTRDVTRAAPGPAAEADEAQSWPERFPVIAAEVPVPVRMTIAEYEQVWPSGPEDLARVCRLFGGSPRVTAHIHPGASHNISLTLAARGYHLQVLGFAEECTVWAGSGRR